MFLKRLMDDFGAKDVGNSLRLPDGIEVAVCNHELGRWVLTPAGEKTLAGEAVEATPAPKKMGRPAKGLAE